LTFWRQDCAEVSAKPAPHVQAKNQTRAESPRPWIAGTNAVMIRVAQAAIPLPHANR
jgi:hypothetical protein